jgi:hypothetical protein
MNGIHDVQLPATTATSPTLIPVVELEMRAPSLNASPASKRA